MKKSYLALGLVAAVAMSSCSNDDPVVNPNQPAGIENLVPVRLSMTTTAADVEVSGARTRGTGTVGGILDADNVWNYENIYILMTSEQDLSDNGIDDPVWDITDAGGVGPYLKQQFDGSFWARPSQVSTNNGNDGSNKAIWTLDYKVDHNEWWYGAPIDKFYPLKGASQFFAYHIDDAMVDAASEEAPANAYTVEGKEHKYPTVTKANNKMTVDFKIDGSQDLMAGYAAIPSNGYAAQDGGFSAQSARNNEVPQITMEHLLSRFTFQVVKGDENFEKVTLDAIELNSKASGTLTVADPTYATVGEIAWVETEPSEKFNLKQKAVAAYEVEAITNQCTNDANLITFNSASAILTNEPVYWTEADGLHYLADGVKTTVAADDGNLSEPLVELTSGVYNVDGSDQCLSSTDNLITIYGKQVYWTAGDEPYYFADDVVTAVPADAEYSAALVCTNYNLEDGKAALEPFKSLPLNTLNLSIDEFASVGEALFVSPETNYTLDVVMTYLVRAKLPGADDAAIAAALAVYEASSKTELDYQTYKDAVEAAGGALTEKIIQHLPLTIDGGFVKGKSYNVKITIYGLKEVVVDVELKNWVDGGEINVGQDDVLNPAP